MRIGGFTYKGIRSTEFNIVSKSVNRPILPIMRQRQLEIPGKHGVYDYGGNTYANRQITIHIAYKGEDYNELRLRAREIAAWLTSTKYEKLIFDDELDKCYLARVYDQVGLQNIFRVGETDVTFECQPFAQKIFSTGEEILLDSDIILDSDITLDLGIYYTFEVTSSPTEIIFENEGTYKISHKSQTGAVSRIVITGSFTTISITLNGKTLNYNEAVNNGVVTIDNINCTVKLGDANKLSMVTGDLVSFLEIMPGINTAIITGADLNCSVLFDFSPLYI